MTNGARRLPGRLRIEYLRPSRRLWLSEALSLARRIGRGHGAGGIWIVALTCALMLGAISATSWLILKDLQ
ncbi:MAG TPA: hypothetical protein VID29_00045 [Solirubrobacteraceae bacterium]|jgi:hypothetical protein